MDILLIIKKIIQCKLSRKTYKNDKPSEGQGKEDDTTILNSWP